MRPLGGSGRFNRLLFGRIPSHRKYCLYVLMHTVCNNTRTVQ